MNLIENDLLNNIEHIANKRGARILFSKGQKT